MDRKWFNITILAFFIINDYFTWVSISALGHPWLIIAIQAVAWIIANAIWEANKQVRFVRLVLWVALATLFNVYSLNYQDKQFTILIT